MTGKPRGEPPEGKVKGKEKEYLVPFLVLEYYGRGKTVKRSEPNRGIGLIFLWSDLGKSLEQ